MTLLVFLGIGASARAQNLYDAAHSLEFANHLYKISDYAAAGIEYERVLHLGSNNAEVALKLLRCYSKANNYPLVVSAVKRFFPDSAYMAKEAGKLYIKALYQTAQYQRVEGFCRANNSFSNAEKGWTLMNMAFIKGSFDTASKLYAVNHLLDTAAFAGYGELVSNIKNYRPKSATKAAILSTLVPGLGKAYTGELRDGLVNFISVSIWGYLTYRGFSLRGYKSGLGYVSGSLGAGFYLGNIYGAALSAMRVNNIEREDWVNDARQLYENYH